MQLSSRLILGIIKLVVLATVLLTWGIYLLYIWWNPAAVPGWVRLPGLRRALMLGMHYEPTVFTLLFGLGFSGLALWALLALLTGKAAVLQQT